MFAFINSLFNRYLVSFLFYILRRFVYIKICIYNISLTIDVLLLYLKTSYQYFRRQNAEPNLSIKTEFSKMVKSPFHRFVFKSKFFLLPLKFTGFLLSIVNQIYICHLFSICLVLVESASF